MSTSSDSGSAAGQAPLAQKNAAASGDLASQIGVGKQGRRSRGLWFWLVLLAVIIVAGGGWWWRQAELAKAAGPMYVTSPLEKGEVSLSVTATGNLEPTNEVTIGSELSGTVQEVYVEGNDHVTAGQPLLKLNTDKLEQQTANTRAAVLSAEAKVLQAQATLDEVQDTLSRQQELSRLSGGKLPSRADMASAVASVARAKADLEVAKANVGSAQAQLLINESDLAKAIIRSPIDGIVLTRSVEPGQTVAASFTAPELFVIAEKLEHMKLKVAIAEADIARLKDGQSATFSVDAWPGRNYDARVTKVSYGSGVTDNVVTYETELEVSNDDLSLRPGMTATAVIDVARSADTFVVPVAALRFEPPVPQQSAGASAPSASFVERLVPGPRRFGRSGSNSRGSRTAAVTGKIWVLDDVAAQPQAGQAAGSAADPEGEPRQIDVRIGLSDGRQTEIISDELKEGMTVILRLNTTNNQQSGGAK